MSVATVYAKALYEAHAQSGGASKIGQMETELASVQKWIDESKELRTVMLGPVVNAKERAAVIEQLGTKAQLSREVSQFLALMARKGRLSLLSEVIAEFGAIRVQAEGGVVGRLVTADPMSPADVDSLAVAFSKKLGKKVSFRVSTDPALLAGIQVSVNGVTYDGTLRSQLRRLREEILSAGRTA